MAHHCGLTPEDEKRVAQIAKDMREGIELSALGAKPANNAFCFCTKCGCTHSVSYAPCDGLRGGYSSAEPPQEGPELTAPALARQEGGGQHYKAMAIQPFEYLLEAGRVQVRTTEGATLAGLRQARHFLDLLIEAEQSAQARSES